MTGIFNRKLIDFSQFPFKETERAFNYGDGLFETIIVRRGEIRFLDYHLERLHKGLKILSINGNEITKEAIEMDIQTLFSKENYRRTIRVKIHVWRKPGGLYTPQNNTANILITVSKQLDRPKTINKAEIAENITLSYSPISGLKTCNALPYILAGLEKKEKKLDEVIILDNNGNLSECSSSNLFWVKGNVIYTPSLSSGCVAGVMRRNILEQARLSKRNIEEVLEKPTTLLTANQVFCCNVTGIYTFKSIGTQTYNIELEQKILRWENR